MASMFSDLPSEIRLLDAGTGVGGLTAAFVTEVCSRQHSPTKLLATTFEIDDALVSCLRQTLDTCKSTCAQRDIQFESVIYHDDFLKVAVDSLGNSPSNTQTLRFNVVILNPPYRKIGTTSHERQLIQQIGLDATNLYAAFTAVAVKLLDHEGELVAIIPRSFCNGPYFRSFRKVILGETAVLRIHVFASRNVFKDDGVLQENVILHVRKSNKKPRTITVSSSNSGADERVVARVLDYADVVRVTNGNEFIHLPTDSDDDLIAHWMDGLPDTLTSLGLTVSTGKVVDFRMRNYLRQEPGADTAPLIYPCHLDEGVVRWPRLGFRKPNGLVRCEETSGLMVPRGFYVVTKRFSSKEEHRRLVAAVYDPNILTAPEVGFENHLNYFHRCGKGLGKEEAYGLAAFLNSAPVDRYFRQFNGHTQVNATDLRSLRYPSKETLNG